jgi:hypothetical protein
LETPIALKNPELRERVRASLTLKVADGFLFIHKTKEAEAVIENFTADYSALIKKRPIFNAHYYLTSAEIMQRERQNSLEAVRRILDAARIILTLEEQQRDPYLTARVVNDLIDVCINEDKFKEAFKIIFNVLKFTGIDPAEELSKLKGILPKSNPGSLAGQKNQEEALQQIIALLGNTRIDKIFTNRGLNLKLNLFRQDMQLKQAEIMVWTRNYQPALQLLDHLKPELFRQAAKGGEELFAISRNLQKARLLIAYGNVYAQWKRSLDRSDDFARALSYYIEAKNLIEADMNRGYPGQELVLARTELYVNLANVYLYGWHSKNLDEAIKFFDRARYAANEIKGNEDLKNYHLSRIWLGLAKIAEEKGEVKIEGVTYWPTTLLKRARRYYDKIIRRKNFAFQQLFSNELLPNHQNLNVGTPTGRFWENLQVSGESTFISSNQRVQPVAELRTSASVRLPLHFNNVPGLENLELTPMFKSNNDLNTHSRSGFQSYYLGLNIKPYYWMNFEANARLGTHDVGSGDKHLKFLTQPDLSLALNLKLPTDMPGFRGLNSTVVADLFFGSPNSKLNSYYANLFYSAGRDFPNPFIGGLSIGAQFNYFTFPYGGNNMFPERYRLYAATVKYEVDLKEFDFMELTWLAHTKAKIGIEASPIYEFARDFYSTGSSLVAMPKDNFGFYSMISLMINTGLFKAKLFYRYEGIQQDFRGRYQLNDRWQNSHQVGVSLEWKF